MKPTQIKTSRRVTEIRDLAPGARITGVEQYAADGTPFIRPNKRAIPVQEIEPCPGQWRTHVHLNGGNCWDGRTKVTWA